MNKEDIERMFACGIKLGVIQTLKELNLIDDKLPLAKAYKPYGGKKIVDKWLLNGWIQLYHTGNAVRGKYYVRRSECETAKLMLDASNILPQNEIEARVEPVHVRRNKNKYIITNQ